MAYVKTTKTIKLIVTDIPLLLTDFSIKGLELTSRFQNILFRKLSQKKTAREGGFEFFNSDLLRCCVNGSSNFHELSVQLITK